METMRYNKINKSKMNIGMFTFTFFIIIGSFTVFYMLKNEPLPVILGEDPLKQVNNIIYEETINLNKIDYKINTASIILNTGKFKANIQVPSITIDGIEMEKINNLVYNKFKLRYESVKSEAAAGLENNFTYKVSYKAYDNILKDNRIISITMYERIMDDLSKKEVRFKLHTLNIDLETKEELSEDEVASIVLGTNYRNMLKNQIKDYVISNNMMKETNYAYSLTGLEEFYIKENKFHIIFNPGELVDSKYDYLDIIIK